MVSFYTRVEDILSITISYRFRYVYLFGAWTGEWESVTNTYEKGEQGWILGMNPLWIFNLGEHHELDEIYPITQAEIPDEVMDIYQDDLGGSTSDLDSLNLYRIRLQQFPGTTLITGYDIQNIITTKILYVYQGEVYEAATDVINQDNVEPELTSTIDWMAIADWILANWQYILIGVVGILVLSVAAKAFTAVSTILGLVFKAIGAAIKGFGYLLKYMAMGVFYFFKFMFYWLPKGIWGFLVFLVVPSEKRRKGKERGIYAGRSL